MIHERSSDTNAGSSGSGYHNHLIGEGNWLAKRAQGCSSRIDVDKLARPALAAARMLPVTSSSIRCAGHGIGDAAGLNIDLGAWRQISLAG